MPPLAVAAAEKPFENTFSNNSSNCNLRHQRTDCFRRRRLEFHSQGGGAGAELAQCRTTPPGPRVKPHEPTMPVLVERILGM
jgi:hypothetical protein